MNQTQEIELNIEVAQEAKAVGDALERLRLNPDFKKVILDGYCTENAVRLVRQYCSPTNQIPENKAKIDTQIAGIGSFMQFLMAAELMGDQASAAIAEGNDMLDSIRAGDLA